MQPLSGHNFILSPPCSTYHLYNCPPHPKTSKLNEGLSDAQVHALLCRRPRMNDSSSSVALADP